MRELRTTEGAGGDAQTRRVSLMRIIRNFLGHQKLMTLRRSPPDLGLVQEAPPAPIRSCRSLRGGPLAGQRSPPSARAGCQPRGARASLQWSRHRFAHLHCWNSTQHPEAVKQSRSTMQTWSATWIQAVQRRPSASWGSNTSSGCTCRGGLSGVSPSSSRSLTAPAR